MSASVATVSRRPGRSVTVRVAFLVCSFALLPLLVYFVHHHDQDLSGLITRQYERLAFPLHRTASEGDAEALSLLIASGKDIEERNGKGNTPLHAAAQAGNVGTVETLLVAGARVSAISSAGYTPLHRAARYGHAEVARKLLAHGAEPGNSPEGGTSPLYLAARTGHAEMVRLLLEAGAEIEGHFRYATPLAAAARNGHVETVKILINAGANVNGDIEGAKFTSPIFFASQYGHNDIVHMLIEAGADVDGADHKGYSPLHALVNHPNHEEKVSNEIHSALLEAGSNMYSDDNLTNTPPVYWALHSGYNEGLSILMEAGLDPDRLFPIDSVNVVSRHLVEASQRVIASYNSTDIDPIPARDHRMSPLYKAWLEEDFQALNILSAKGANLDLRHVNDATLMHFAIDRHNDFALVEWLLDKGADPDSRDISGSTPLHYASFMGYNNTVKKLLDAGADANATNLAGMSPLQYTTCLGNASTHELLVDQGADPQANQADLETVINVCNEILGGESKWEMRLKSTASPVLMKVRRWEERYGGEIRVGETFNDLIWMICCSELPPIPK